MRVFQHFGGAVDQAGWHAVLVHEIEHLARGERLRPAFDHRVEFLLVGAAGTVRGVARILAQFGPAHRLGFGPAGHALGHAVQARHAALAVGGDEAGADAAVAHCAAAFGGLSILVNNAAFQQHAKSIEDVSDQQLEETMKTNIFGYFYMARAAVPHLQRGGSIINSGSVVGLRGSGELLDYSATKGAIHAFTMSLASSLIDKGIRVNCVAPGPVWTPLNPADRDAESIAQFGKRTDMKRPAQPEELSPAYVFLASPCCASYITGIVLPVTGSVAGS